MVQGRLVVTGGTGFLGGEVVRAAAADGWEVAATFHARAPDLVGARSASAAVTWVPLDLRDPASIDAMFAAGDIAAVIHTAYIDRGPDLHAVTGLGSALVARAATRVGARLVHLSSDIVFDGVTEGAYVEADPVHPIHEYGRAKAEAEWGVAHEDAGAVLVRTSLIYRGPGGGGPLSKHEQVVLDAADGRTPEMAFFTDELRNPVQVTDLARALIELSTRPDIRGPLHVAGSDTLSRHAFAMLIAEANDRDPRSVRGASSAEVEPPRPRDCALDSALAGSLLDVRPRGAHEVLRPAR